jgi:starch phosphorylase
MEAKRELMSYVNRHTNIGMDFDLLTLGFARRATSYKRWDLLFNDLDRLKTIAQRRGPFQIIYSGKAHPRDEGGKALVRQIFQVKESLKKDIKIAYLENYDMEIGKLMTSGVDIWLNTPQPPMEASGTSGMKAALNGVPSLSILDGWWIEGHIEGITGWSIGESTRGMPEQYDSVKDAFSIYQKLEELILPLYYNHRNRFVELMRHAIAINGSFFNTQRMLQQYVLNAYFR